MGINVAITGLHATDNPAPGLGVIRSLRYPDGWDGKIVGLAYDVYDTGIYDRDLLDHTYMFPYPNQGMDLVFQRLAYIHEQIRLDVVIPTLDSELSMFQKLEDKLRDIGIRMFIPTEDVVKKRSKAKLAEFCEEFDIATPRTVTINNPGNLGDVIDDIGFPLYVKGVFYDAYKCNTRDETLQHFEKLRKQWGLPVLIQESLNGEEFDVCAVSDKNGDLLGALPIRKLRLTDKGKAWAAISINNPELYDMSRKILKDLQWTGPCELEIMQESKTKKLYLLEINPRFPAWIYLGTGTEQNLPKLIIDLALGKKVDKLPQAKSGVSFVRHATDLVCPLDYLENLTMNGELHY
jgi:carbamoyl-phosphate synthase large subunit